MDKSQYVNITQAALRCGRSARWVYTRLQAGDLTAYVGADGRAKYISVAELDALTDPRPAD